MCLFINTIHSQTNMENIYLARTPTPNSINIPNQCMCGANIDSIDRQRDHKWLKSVTFSLTNSTLKLSKLTHTHTLHSSIRLVSQPRNDCINDCITIEDTHGLDIEWFIQLYKLRECLQHSLRCYVVIINRRWVAGRGRAEPTQVQINRGHPISPVEIRAGFVIEQLLSQRGGEVVSWVAG